MIGNDIVDLRQAALESDPLRPRFLKKVFTPNEQLIISQATKVLNQVWLLWTMKEAAYKAHQRRFSLPRKFNPLLLECVILNQSKEAALGEVRIGTEVYFLYGTLHKDYIHSIASIYPKDEKTGWEIFPSSEDLRQQFINKVSRQFGYEVEVVGIEKDINFIPFLLHNNTRLKLPFSLSSHGKFSAYTFELMNY